MRGAVVTLLLAVAAVHGAHAEAARVQAAAAAAATAPLACTPCSMCQVSWSVWFGPSCVHCSLQIATCAVSPPHRLDSPRRQAHPPTGNPRPPPPQTHTTQCAQASVACWATCSDTCEPAAKARLGGGGGTNSSSSSPCRAAGAAYGGTAAWVSARGRAHGDTGGRRAGVGAMRRRVALSVDHAL